MLALAIALPTPRRIQSIAGIVFAMRLQTHNGDNIPLGLYQDTGVTIPATADGDPLSTWRDELSGSGVVAIQGASEKQPLLFFVDGVPTVWFDGVDDYLDCGVARGASSQSTIIGLGDIVTTLSYNGLVIGKDQSGWSGSPFIGISPEKHFAIGDSIPVPNVDLIGDYGVISSVADASSMTISNGTTDGAGSIDPTGHDSVATTIGDRAGGARPVSFSCVSAFIISDPAPVETIRAYAAELNP